MINKRDLAILKDLERFRVLSRNDLVDLHFSHLKDPINGCNKVMKRLLRDGYVERNADHHPYFYFPSPTAIKKDSAKIPHFLKIVEFYKSLLKYEQPKVFQVEPKYGNKGQYMEPDGFFIWRKGVFFLEIQRSVYSDKVMKAKIQRYENYYLSNEWKEEPWQPSGRKIFPPIIMITDTRYNINSPYLKVYQVQHIDQLVSLFQPKPEPIQIKIK